MHMYVFGFLLLECWDVLNMAKSLVLWIVLAGTTFHFSSGGVLPTASKGHNMDWEDYHELEDINGYLIYLADNYPNNVQLLTIGNSSEGRPLYLLHVSSNFSSKNRAIWIDGGMHAREWISPAVTTYIINQLVEEQSNQKLLNRVDYYIMPVANPDGYKYSFTDRLWRKNRSQHSGFLETICLGTDINRNFDIHFMESGSSSNPCAHTYAGPHAFSEPESRAISKFILENIPQIRMYLTLHSFGQYWLVPYGYDEVYPEDYDTLLRLAERAAEKTTQYKYVVGNTAQTLYPSAGGSDDWAKSVGVKYSYTIELPPVHGDKVDRFMLQPEKILLVSEDFFPAMKVLIQEIATI